MKASPPEQATLTRDTGPSTTEEARRVAPGGALGGEVAGARVMADLPRAMAPRGADASGGQGGEALDRGGRLAPRPLEAAE